MLCFPGNKDLVQNLLNSQSLLGCFFSDIFRWKHNKTDLYLWHHEKCWMFFFSTPLAPWMYFFQVRKSYPLKWWLKTWVTSNWKITSQLLEQNPSPGNSAGDLFGMLKFLRGSQRSKPCRRATNLSGRGFHQKVAIQLQTPDFLFICENYFGVITLNLFRNPIG